MSGKVHGRLRIDGNGRVDRAAASALPLPGVAPPEERPESTGQGREQRQPRATRGTVPQKGTAGQSPHHRRPPTLVRVKRWG